MSSVEMMHLMSLLCKEALSHAPPRSVAGTVCNSAAEVQPSRPNDKRGVPHCGINPPAFRPLTHCGTISVPTLCRPAQRHLSHSVPTTLRSTRLHCSHSRGRNLRRHRSETLKQEQRCANFLINTN